MRNIERKISLIWFFNWIIIVFILGACGVGCYSCVSWITSGEAGKDIGQFAGSIEKGYNETKE